MAHTNYGSQPQYIIKCRDRELTGGRSRHHGKWGKWKGVRYGIATEEAAREDMSQRNRHAPLTEFAIFYRGKRLPNKVNG